jgi:hypothetical protein
VLGVKLCINNQRHGFIVTCVLNSMGLVKQVS